MLYKVFLVEDEIVAREGIRDNVDWHSAGFEFCGEASDGEVALPLIQKIQPDVLITDIKMPFMDGLQLCRIIRERMPWIKIVILSGHDEFNYAQAAVKLGVMEYLLKPVGVQDLNDVLHKVARQLDQERQEKESLQRLKSQAEDTLALRREKFLLKLVMGGVSSSEAVEESQRLNLDIIAHWYQIVLLKVELYGSADQFDYHQFQQVKQLALNLVENNPDVFLLKKDLEELVLILKGDTPEYLQQERYFLSELIKNEVESKTNCSLIVGVGTPRARLGDIYQSLVEAMTIVQNSAQESRQVQASHTADKAELLKLDNSKLEEFLKFGTEAGFEPFFTGYIQPLSETALESYLIKNYIFIDIVLTSARFVHQLGGMVDQVIPEINHVETLLLNIKTLAQIQAETRKIFLSALAFRDSQIANQYGAMILEAKDFIDSHFADPGLSLSDVANQVGLSSSHFSAVFSRESGETFKEYLTKARIEKAKELLKMTELKAFEIAYQVGYKDPHYFSAVFKRQTGLSPSEFRQ